MPTARTRIRQSVLRPSSQVWGGQTKKVMIRGGQAMPSKAASAIQPPDRRQVT